MYIKNSKLKQNKGMTIIVALFFLLISAILGAAILAAASGNATRAANQRDTVQPYMTLSSATQMIADGLGEMTYSKVSYTTPISECGSNHAAKDIDSKYQTPGSKVTISNGNTEVNQLSYIVNKLANTIDGKTVDTASATAVISSSNLQDVSVKIEMDSRYNLTFTFALMENGAVINKYGHITLRYNASVEDNTIELTGKHEYTDGETSKMCTYSCDKRIIKVVWDSTPIITNGEA